MEFRIQLDPGVAAAAHRTVFETIPPEYREVYAAHLSDTLATMLCTQTVETDRVLEAA